MNRPSPSFMSRILQTLGFKKAQDEQTELLTYLRDLSKNTSIITKNTLAIIEGALDCAHKQTHEIMISRSKIISVNIDNSLQEIIDIVVASGHSRFPVFDSSKQNVVGILLAKDLLQFVTQNSLDNFNINDVIRSEPVSINENKRLLVLLNEFRTTRQHMAIVYTEYGDLSGLITIEDVLEEIVGDIEDEYDIDEVSQNIKGSAENGYTIKATTSIDEFNEFFNTEFDDNEFDTIGGLVMQQCANIPKSGEVIALGDHQFKIIQASKKRILSLQLLISG